MAAQRSGASELHMDDNTVAAADAGPAAPAVENEAAAAAVGNAHAAAAAVGRAAVPIQPRFDVEAGLLGSPLRKTNEGCQILAKIKDTA